MRYIVLVLFTLFLSCKKEGDNPTYISITDFPGYFSKENVNYDTITEGVDTDLLSLTTSKYTDTLTKRPIIIYVHGGGWCVGDKDQKINDKASLFASMGYVFISVNYRLSPFPYDINNEERVQFPTHNNDLAHAIKWVYDNIGKYGGDKDKIALLGHSAGAHLVALTGTNSQFLEEVGLSLSVIKGVAVIDTQGYDVREQVLNGENKNMYINAFGTNEAQNIMASPIFHVNSDIDYPNFFIAKRGSAARITYANEFIAMLSNNGVDVSQVNGSLYNHTEINNAIGKNEETLITDPLKAFFIHCFE